MDWSFIANDKVLIILILVGCIAIFLMAMSVIFYIYELKDQKHFSHKIKEYKEEFYTQTLKDIQNNKTTRTLYDRVDLLLSRSQLKYNFSWNIKLLFALILLMFLYGYFVTIDIIGGFFLPLVIAIVFAIFPIITIEFISSYKGKKLKSQIISLIPILINNAKLTGGDIFKTIKNTVPKVNAPLKMYLAEFVYEYENGVSPATCFDNLRYKIADSRFTRIVDCLETHLYKGGNVVVTLGSLNKEYLAREVEEDRRKKEHSSTVLGIYISVLGNILILYIVNMVMPEIVEELKKNDIVMALIVINILISLMIGYAATRIQSHSKY